MFYAKTHYIKASPGKIIEPESEIPFSNNPLLREFKQKFISQLSQIIIATQ